MLQSQTTSTLESYWASYFGCLPADLYCRDPRLIRHGSGLAEYNGLLAFYRSRVPLISIPLERFDTLSTVISRLPTADIVSPARLAVALTPMAHRVIGPASLSYADRATLREPRGGARMLTREDLHSIGKLQAACRDQEWEHGGTTTDSRHLAGVFLEGQLVALTGYEIWGGVIAHLSVITHPEFRGRGFGLSAVSILAHHAIEAGLVPQYRTLEANIASVRLGQSLGFQPYATSVAARFSSESA